MNMGKIVGVHHDDLTDTCLKNIKKVPALGGAASKQTSSCEVTPLTNSSKGENDLKIFVSWTGTDAVGTALISSNDRFVNFQPFKLANLELSLSSLPNSL